MGEMIESGMVCAALRRRVAEDGREGERWTGWEVALAAAGWVLAAAVAGMVAVAMFAGILFG